MLDGLNVCTPINRAGSIAAEMFFLIKGYAEVFKDEKEGVETHLAYIYEVLLMSSCCFVER